MLKPIVYIFFIIQYTMLFYLDITCEQWFDEMLLEIAIQVIALHNNLKKNRKYQAVSIYMVKCNCHRLKYLVLHYERVIALIFEEYCPSHYIILYELALDNIISAIIL